MISVLPAAPKVYIQAEDEVSPVCTGRPAPVSMIVAPPPGVCGAAGVVYVITISPDDAADTPVGIDALAITTPRSIANIFFFIIFVPPF